MLAFLSDDWVAALDGAARVVSVDPAVAPARTLTLEQVVETGTGAEVRYHMVVGSGGLRVHPGPALDPDLVILSDLGTAAALADGRVGAQQALADGRLRVRGHPEVLAVAAPVFAALGDVFGAVRARTSLDLRT